MAATVRELTVAQVTALLTRRFPLKTISHVTEEYDALAGKPIRIYVPNLVEHAARHRLSHEPAITT
ncbi:hypothetical protein AX769_21480 (plasmid) [Frondihabitans sp. PAMC 28766]|uniref:three-helix bundle dimerization domain-containing protein n=1 Tax=Frondihabitans sp. PAMC 28766 TaxID=1795630 RepID=UPI00078C8B2B|nr:hypothetical protein [Frondihabitans sp. PAMC 28766]AMM22697.1 hypothetical protein AX769_21480 [Frondihabitans sp. PAMC 28766]